MKLKYKLGLLTVTIILVSSLSVSIYIINVLKKEKIAAAIGQGRISSEIAARTALKLLIMNGGDLEAARIDSAEMISMFGPLQREGLVFAETVLSSGRRHLDGCRLAVFRSGSISAAYMAEKCSDGRTVESLRELAAEGWREISLPELGGGIYEVAVGVTMEGYAISCFGRMLFSKEAVLKPLDDLILGIQGSVAGAILLVIAAAFFITSKITGPLNLLTEGAKKISEGQYSHIVPHRGGDEIGTLASAFNEMSGMITSKISELEALNIELKRVDRLKDEFLANTSHELKTPLNGIIGIAELLKERISTINRAEAETDLSIIAESGRRLDALVNDILDHARMRNGDMALHIRPVDLGTALSHVFALCSSSARKKGISLINGLTASLPMVLADEDRLQQILLNLLGNAVKFTPEGNVTVTAEEINDRVVITMADTGIGMDSEEIEKIFDPFYQADGSASRGYSGVGLGLSVTRQLVELHSGSIDVQSAPGEGSRFRVSLPSAGFGRVVDRSAPYETDAGITSTEGLKISEALPFPARVDTEQPLVLLVDDEAVNLRVAANILLHEGFRVETAAGGAEALKIIEERGAPDLVLLDVMMPGMTGYDVCRKLRESYLPFELPIIMLTAKSRESDILPGFEAGANDYIPKPVNRGVLAARVRSFITLKKAVEQHSRLMLIEEELNIATAIQRSILPPKMAEGGPVRLSAVYKPAGMVGGDFYDYSLSPDGNLSLIIADVTGHGVPAALVASMLKIAFTQNLRHFDYPERVLEAINNALYATHSGQIITAQTVFIDTTAGTLALSNAGHWPALLLKRGTDSVTEIHCRGIPLCVMPGLEYSRTDLHIMRGDRIVFYTDGIIEAVNAEGEMLGEHRFRNRIMELRDLTGEKFVNRISTIVDDWSAMNPDPDFKDDYCIICVDIV